MKAPTLLQLTLRQIQHRDQIINVACQDLTPRFADPALRKRIFLQNILFLQFMRLEVAAPTHFVGRSKADTTYIEPKLLHCKRNIFIIFGG